MKLSELNTDQALDALCELTPYVANIMDDEKVINGLGAIMPEKPDKEEDINGLVVGAHMLGGLGKMAPTLLRTHRADVYGILSVVNEKSVTEIGAQPVMDTIRQIKDVFQDTELLSFFKSYTQRARSVPSAPSADSPACE